MGVEKVLCPSHLPEVSTSSQREREWGRLLRYVVARGAWPWSSEAAAPKPEEAAQVNTPEANRSRLHEFRARDAGGRAYVPRQITPDSHDYSHRKSEA